MSSPLLDDDGLPACKVQTVQCQDHQAPDPAPCVGQKTDSGVIPNAPLACDLKDLSHVLRRDGPGVFIGNPDQAKP